jgi:anti-sigma regulatory factor (Ser/Thr protein kinase)
VKSKNQITRAAELDSLPIFREYIKNICKGHPGINDEHCYDVQLAVDEACTNIITHGYADIDPGSIILCLDLFENEISIIIIDFGHPFEPFEIDMPDVEGGLEGMPMGGFGLFLIYQTMDEVNYENTENGNHLKFKKYLKKE